MSNLEQYLEKLRAYKLGDLKDMGAMGPNMQPMLGATPGMPEQGWEADEQQFAPQQQAQAAELPPNPKQAYGDKKVPMHLVPAAGQIYEALAFGEGARKYGAYNWRTKAVEALTYIGACQRHMLAYLDGEDIDSESGVHHLGLARACLGILLDAAATGNLLDNRPPKGCAAEMLRRPYPRYEPTIAPIP